MPGRCWGQETFPKYTINKIQNYPSTTERTLPYFASRTLPSATDVDENGKTIFVHLMTSMKYCGLSLEIARNCFKRDEPRMSGNYTVGMTRKITGPFPHMWTALHCVCNGKDPESGSKDVIMDLLENEIVTVTDFDSLTNDEVTVFLGLRT